MRRHSGIGDKNNVRSKGDGMMGVSTFSEKERKIKKVRIFKCGEQDDLKPFVTHSQMGRASYNEVKGVQSTRLDMIDICP
jgi:hypothetical protein